jgi:glucuronide carrier protein
MGQAIGGAAGAYALGIVAFNSQWAKDGTPQAPETVAGIQLWTGGLVVGFIVLSLLIMWFYPLTDKVFRQIVGEIAARRAERELTESVASEQR